MPNLKHAVICFCLLTAAASTQAHATAIDYSFTNSQSALGYIITQDGLTATTVQAPDGFINWPGYGADFSADKNNSDVTVNYPLATTSFALTNNAPFTFQSIGIANVHNTNEGGSFLFTFNLASGGLDSQVVTLAPKQGLQIFTFDKYVNSVVLQGLGTLPDGADQSPQFDDVTFTAGAVSAVPLPASLPMFGAAVLALGGIGLGLNRRAGAQGKSVTAT